MDFSISGNAMKTFSRSITCLGRVGYELVIEASPSQLALYTLNSSRSAYMSITFKRSFFDVYTISGSQTQCSVLLKAICSVLRTPVASIDHLSVQLPDPDAPKVKWTLDCCSGIRKIYWITCNVEPDIQHLSLDKRQFPSNFGMRPRELNKLLGNFQSSLQEITIIAAEPNSLPSDAANEIGGKAVEFRSYIDPTKEKDSLLHTQLWIDPLEEFLQYTHNRNPVDVTFAVRELKAFLSFCEGCEVDIHLYFDKAGEPILMAPNFGLDDASNSDFDATLVLATMLTSQLHECNQSEPLATGVHNRAADGMGSQQQRGNCRQNKSEHTSEHTRIWSELSVSAGRSGGGAVDHQAQGHRDLDIAEQGGIRRINEMCITRNETVKNDALAGRCGITEQGFSQHHPSNWLDANEDDEDNADEDEMCVQATPPSSDED